MWHFIYRFFKFGVVGTFGTFIDFAVTAFLMVAFGLRAYLDMGFEDVVQEMDNVAWVVLFVNAVGFVVAATCNYYLNRIWTWRSKDPNVSNEYGRFFFVSVLGLAINLVAIYFFANHANLELSLPLGDGEGYFISNFWMAKILATLVVMFWNFFANNFFTFREKYVDSDSLEEFKDVDAEEED